MRQQKPSTIVGARIQKLQRVQRLTLMELAKRARVDKGGLSRIIAGESPEPRLPTLVKIADCLSTSLDYLAGRAENEPEGMNRRFIDKTAQALFSTYTQLSPENRLDLVQYAKYLQMVEQKELKKTG